VGRRRFTPKRACLQVELTRGRKIVSLSSAAKDKWRRFDNLFVEREFFMRAHGEVRFLKVTARLQRRVAYSVLAILGVWLLITLGMVANQFTLSAERMMLVRKEEKVATAEDRVAAYRDSIDEVAEDVEQRQDVLDNLWKSHFGDVKPLPQTLEGQADSDAADKISAAIPEASHLAQLERRQLAFAVGMTQMAKQRAASAERQIRSFGLRPTDLITADNRASGGPLIPFFNKKQVDDPRFTALESALNRMNALESALASIPSGNPSIIPDTSSQFGYRSDPFTGGGAMHSGIDFKGAHGSPILAAAGGEVTFAGWRGGYGRCVEITHGNGMLTRYAHMSSLSVVQGQRVGRGANLGGMGSTGRSTGTHLHFEVRINGKAVDPAKFLRRKPRVQP
jgi:murein DD-endopeptidase MepM/ murein hydrolase activator NlpD